MFFTNAENQTSAPDNDEMARFTTSTVGETDETWNGIKSFFTLQNSMIILAIVCLVLLFLTLCLVFLVIHLLKKNRSDETPPPPAANHLPPTYSKLDHQLKFPSSPIQTGLTSNQIASLGNIVANSRDIRMQDSTPTMPGSSSLHGSNQTQSFDNLDSELKRVWNEKGIISNPAFTNDDEVETVNEVLEMEERNGKVYYKVNFTGHPSEYTAWVCEEDLIPE